jgi:hypothetical protein
MFLFFGNTENAIALQPSRLYCYQAAWSTIPGVIASVILVIAFFIATLGSISYCNFSLVMLMRTAKVKHDKKRKEWLLTKRAIVISVSFMAYFTPHLIRILAEFSSKQPVSDILDTITSYIIMSSPLINGILLIQYDTRIRRNIKDMFGVDKIWTVNSGVKSPSPKIELAAQIKELDVNGPKINQNGVKPNLNATLPDTILLTGRQSLSG